MSSLFLIIVLISIVGIVVSLIQMIISAIRKQGKDKRTQLLMFIGLLVVSFIGFNATYKTDAKVSIDKEVKETVIEKEVEDTKNREEKIEEEDKVNEKEPIEDAKTEAEEKEFIRKEKAEITDEKIQELENLLKNEASDYLDIEDLQVDNEQKIITVNAIFDYKEQHDNNVFQAEQESVNFEMGVMAIAEVLAETDLFNKYIINTNEMDVVVEDRHKVKDEFGYSFDDTNLSEEIESYFMKKNKAF